MTNLKRIRTEKKLTQLELSVRTGTSFRTIQDYEQGRKPINGAAALTVYKLAQELGVTVEDLLELE